MDLSRRDFLKISGVATAGTAVGTLGFGLKPVEAQAQTLAIKYAKETLTICPYCSVGCGILIHSVGNAVISCEGDPDHPVSEGALCPKGRSVEQLSGNQNKLRLTKPQYRASGSDKWEELSWGKAIEMIAKRVKDARDATFVTKNKDGMAVNRCEGMASVGSAAMDNEECYLYQKLLRSWGLVYIEHQARI
jgi:formate dehydrogenase major subunit